MGDFIQLSMNGLAVGSVYALAALGFVLVYQATGIVNFATGQFVMLGTFVAVSTVMEAKIGGPWGFLLALVGMACFGLLFHHTVFRSLQNRPIMTVIIGTVAAGIVMQNAALLTWGSWPFRLPSPFPSGQILLGGGVISVHFVFAIATTTLLILLLYLLLFKTALGRQMRAVAQDIEAARLMGVRANRVIALTWVLTAVITGMAGILIGPVWYADVNMGDPLAIKAFAATIIGGFGSVPGAIVGGVFVGLSEVLGAGYVSSTYKDVFAFALMVLVLLVRPQGIFGEKIGERG